MQERHSNRERYFNEQSLATKKYAIPYINTAFPVNPAMSVVEMGCGEAGNQTPFLDIQLFV